MNEVNSQAVTALLLHNSDNVYCVLRDHQAGDTPIVLNAEGNHCPSSKLLDNILLGHKVALTLIEKDTAVVKYGAVIGYAIQTIPAGSHVHLHNVIGSLQSKLES